MPRGTDRAALAVTDLLAAALCVTVVVALFSTMPREITSAATLHSYLASDLGLTLVVSSTVVLPVFMVTTLAVVVIDMIRGSTIRAGLRRIDRRAQPARFNRRAEVLLRTTERCAMIVADLDFFKRVNDALGHAGGDRVLIAFTRTLSESPKNGRIVGRIGGEEFAVLLPRSDLDAAVEWAEGVRTRTASHSIDVGTGTATATASFGIAAGDARTQLTTLIDAADKALYTAELGGRNQTIVSR
ncbi:GGDEF domain-containing protein [Tsukamurella soli]|uniref:GGDEF domain-containing protein n=1 Tax=Tsukamurella soli TaxID=644556 RepID=A0ABP8J9W8_9ACTN